ncbi:hypothetical protein AKO1_005054 [Acrasis kona]|uniref:Uncharacterized protein n=1 Tax=Acrasis kona TaxID=1008807 RepID=A0AAW2Z4R7_9EUKA
MRKGILFYLAGLLITLTLSSWAYVGVTRFRQSQRVRSWSAGKRILSLSTQDQDNTVEIVTRSNETNGLYSKVILRNAYHGVCGNNPSANPPLTRPCTPPLHYHLKIREIFKVTKGELGYILNGEKGIKKVGESVDVRPLDHHTIWAEGNGDVEAEVLLQNSGPTPIGAGDDTYVENFYSVVRDSNGHPETMEEYYLLSGNDVYLAKYPRAVNAAIYSVVNVIAPLLGYKVHYREYTTNYDLIPPEKRI